MSVDPPAAACAAAADGDDVGSAVAVVEGAVVVAAALDVAGAVEVGVIKASVGRLLDSVREGVNGRGMVVAGVAVVGVVVVLLSTA